MELIVKITIGIISLVIAVSVIWFGYSMFSKKETTTNLTFSEPVENVDLYKIPISRPQMVTPEKISSVENNKKLKLLKTYETPESFNLQVEGKSLNVEFANAEKEWLGALSIDENGGVIFNSVEYPGTIKDGKKIFTISIIDEMIFINSIKLDYIGKVKYMKMQDGNVRSVVIKMF